MGNNESLEKEYDSTRRVEEYLKKYNFDEKKYSNSAKLFRNEFFLGLNQKIHNKVFFDNGRDPKEPFKPLEELQNAMVDAFFDTTVSDPQNDKILKRFLRKMKKKYDVIIPSKEPSREVLEEKILNLSRYFISEVISFFGEIHLPIKKRCDETIKRLKNERESNIIYLGDVKGCGECRHRVILFKLLCDTFNIPCRILRGWLKYEGNKGAHAWNEIVLKKKSFIVDTMNFRDFVEIFPRTKEGYLIEYVNLGHPQRKLELQKKTIDHIKNLYTENNGRNLRIGKHLGQGAFGVVYELLDVDCVYEEPSEDEEKRYLKVIRKTLSVKEVNLTELGLLSSEEEKQHFERMIKRELEMMTLFQHPNIVKVIGSFSSKRNHETFIRLVMEKYEMNGLKFLGLLGSKENSISPKKLSIEVLIFLLEICKGISFIHSFGIVHFDIHPKNILLNWNETQQCISDIVISDFGSSKNQEMNLNLTTKPHINKKFAANEVLEMIKKEEENELIVDPSFVFTTKSDIYSFGVLMGFFLKYLKEYPILEIIQQKCLSKIIEERPEINEIKEEIYKIISTTKKKIIFQNIPCDLYTWGSGYNYKLGHGEKSNEFLPRFVSSLSSFDVKKVFCGYLNCSVLLSNEEVLSWGKNDCSQLGKKTEEICITIPSIQNKMKLEENRKIIQVSHGFYISFYLDNFGDIWGCGDNEYGFLTGKKSEDTISSPFLITSKSKEFQKIKSIHSFNNSFGCVSFDGKLFTWGMNKNGKLFHSKYSEEILSPTIVEYFCNVRIKQIAIGYYESFVLTEDGKVYSSKKYWNDLSESNEENITSSLLFGLISFGSEDCKITKISSGWSHYGALDSFGNCYMWGSGSYGKLGNGSRNGSSFPFRLNQFYNFEGKLTPLEIPSKHKFIQLECGIEHTIALLEEKLTPNESKFHVLTWGVGTNGQLGTKSIKFKKIEYGDKHFPFPVIVPFFEDKIVKSISSKGYWSSAIVLNPKNEKKQKEET